MHSFKRSRRVSYPWRRKTCCFRFALVRRACMVLGPQNQSEVKKGASQPVWRANGSISSDQSFSVWIKTACFIATLSKNRHTNCCGSRNAKNEWQFEFIHHPFDSFVYRRKTSEPSPKDLLTEVCSQTPQAKSYLETEVCHWSSD